MGYVHWAVAAALIVSGCAKGSKSISASYVNPVMYQSFDCEQIKAEAMRLSSKASELAGVQDKKARNDAFAMGVGLVVFWPALFFIKGNDERAGELARVRGEMEAVQQASIQKNCGIEFKAPEPAPKVAAKDKRNRPGGG